MCVRVCGPDIFLRMEKTDTFLTANRRFSKVWKKVRSLISFSDSNSLFLTFFPQATSRLTVRGQRSALCWQRWRRVTLEDRGGQTSGRPSEWKKYYLFLLTVVCGIMCECESCFNDECSYLFDLKKA